MRRSSLAFRLIASAALWSAVALIAAALIITSLYRQAVEEAFDERLDVYLTTLVGQLANQSPSALTDPGNLSEQRFENPYSGWYWQVRRRDGGPVVIASKSLFNDVIAVPPDATRRVVEKGVTSLDLAGPDGQTLRGLDREIDFGPGNSYDVLVAGNAGAVQEQIATFRRSVILTLAVFGVGLVLSTTIQIRWGLRPLDRVRRALAALRSGKETRVTGPFPVEIEPLARELNALLDSNQEIIERARTQVGNLAHALKTPLSVITNEARANKGALADKVAEQAAVMRLQVNHYLDRARIAARSRVIGAVTEVEPVVARLVRTMDRIHDDRDIAVSARVADRALFRGEQQDLEEIVGNLVDNACKWAASEVTIDIGYEKPANDEMSGRLTLHIDDDGPGLAEEQRAEATRRGRRLDETKPGSGLGLSIVTELVALYDGKFSLDRSPAGGLRAAIELPAA
jgi:signal transduction histidine kinase